MELWRTSARTNSSGSRGPTVPPTLIRSHDSGQNGAGDGQGFDDAIGFSQPQVGPGYASGSHSPGGYNQGGDGPEEAVGQEVKIGKIDFPDEEHDGYVDHEVEEETLGVVLW